MANTAIVILAGTNGHAYPGHLVNGLETNIEVADISVRGRALESATGRGEQVPGFGKLTAGELEKKLRRTIRAG